MAEGREPLGRIAHATYRDWLAEQVQRVYGDEAQLGSWEDLAEGMREAYMRIAAAVAARVRADIAADFKRLAGDLVRHPLVSPGVPGIVREARRDAYLAAAVVAVNGLSPQGRDDEKEADRG